MSEPKTKLTATSGEVRPPSVRATLRLWLITLMLVLFNLSMMRLG